MGGSKFTWSGVALYSEYMLYDASSKSVSFVLSRNSLKQCFDHGDLIEIRDEIIHTGVLHIYSIREGTGPVLTRTCSSSLY